MNDGSEHIAVFRVELEKVKDFSYIHPEVGELYPYLGEYSNTRLDIPNTRADISPVLGEIHL